MRSLKLDSRYGLEHEEQRGPLTVRIFTTIDDTPIRGNALASGDDTIDRQCEDEIIARLNSCDVWAWALVAVEVEITGFYGSDYLGACSFHDVRDFIASGYFDDMVDRATDDLKTRLETLAAPTPDTNAIAALKRLREG